MYYCMATSPFPSVPGLPGKQPERLGTRNGFRASGSHHIITHVIINRNTYGLYTLPQAGILPSRASRKLPALQFEPGLHRRKDLLQGALASSTKADSYFVDRDGLLFEHVLSFFRSGFHTFLHGMIYEADHHKYIRLLAEAEYFSVETLCVWINPRKHGGVSEKEISKAMEASA